MLWIKRVIFLFALLPLAMCDGGGVENSADGHDKAPQQQEVVVDTPKNKVEKDVQKANTQNQMAPAQETAVDVQKSQANNTKYKAGVHYDILPQAVRTANPNKIEINEVFAYTCSHCYSFESELHPWADKLPGYVDFQRTPAVWQPRMELYARAYYAAVVLKVLDQVHEPIFEAIHLDKKRIDDEQDLAAIFVANGVDKDKFSQAFNSFGTTSMVNQAKARLVSYRVQGTPEVIVNGKYRVSTRKAGGFSGVLDVAEFLIQKERAQTAK